MNKKVTIEASTTEPGVLLMQINVDSRLADKPVAFTITVRLADQELYDFAEDFAKAITEAFIDVLPRQLQTLMQPLHEALEQLKGE